MPAKKNPSGKATPKEKVDPKDKAYRLCMEHLGKLDAAGALEVLKRMTAFWTAEAKLPSKEIAKLKPRW
jgi:hypothetical protein